MEKQVTLSEIKDPVGSFILANAVGTQTPNGKYYHYSEVCILLNKFEAALSKAEDKGNYILITDVKNLFNASVFFYELMQVANIKNEDGMQVVEYINKPNGGSVAYLRHDAVVKKLNKILQSLPNHIGEANEMITSKAEVIKPVEDVAYMLDKMEKFQVEDTDYDYSSMNDEISKAEDKGEGLEPWEFGVDAVFNALTKPKPTKEPTNSLDELEKWVLEQIKDFNNSSFESDKEVGVWLQACVIAKIQELKTITPNNGWISVKHRLPEVNENVLLHGKMYGWIQTGILFEGVFYRDHNKIEKIKPTHWQQLPPKP